jgi:addiction module HigA family antidote
LGLRTALSDAGVRAVMRLTQLDAATVAEDMRQPPSNRLEALSGKRAGQWSVRINDQWRVCFRFESGNAFDVEIVDYLMLMKTKTPVNNLPAIHPGEFLRETLDELGLTQAAFAEAIGVSPMRVSHLLKGDRPVTAELALRLGRALGQTPQYWLNLQSTYDLKKARTEMKDSLLAVQELIAA